MYIYLCLGLCAQECRCLWRPETSLGSGINMMLSHVMWVLGHKLGSSGKVASILSC